MQKYYTECRSHFNSTILGRRRLVSSESCMIADPFQKDCILMPLHTPTKGSQVIPKLLTATSSWWFWAKTTTAIFVGECHRWRNAAFGDGHFQWATSSYSQRKFEGTNSWSVQSFFVQISGSWFFTHFGHHLFGAKERKWIYLEKSKLLLISINLKPLTTSNPVPFKKMAKNSYVFPGSSPSPPHISPSSCRLAPPAWETHQMRLPGTVPHRSHGRIHSLEPTKKYRERMKQRGVFLY